jgi:hypothetical protein
MRIYLAGTPGGSAETTREHEWVAFYSHRLLSYYDISAGRGGVPFSFKIIKEHNERILLRPGKEGREAG